MGVTRTSNGTGKLIAALLSFFLIEAGGLIGYVVGSLFGFDIDISYTFAQAVVAILVLIGLGGGSYLRFDRDAIIESWKFMWWIIVLSAILMVWDLSDFVLAGEVVQRGWFLRCLSSLLLCVCIGISEEGMFRGTLFGGLLARFGEKKNGILWCVALSSLAFGCAHVLPEDFDFTRWYTVVQALLKLCQTGIYAVMLCTVVLKTRSFVGAMMIHALDDYLLFISWRGGGQNQVGREPNKIYGIFSSDNETVATVDDEGVIHAKSAGIANINFSGKTELLEEYQHGKVWTFTVIVKDTSGTSTGSYVKMLGDADLSGTISVSDIVTVLQYAANKDKYPLDSRAITNSDVNGDGVVDTKDAFIIQQVDAGVVKQSDLPLR